METPMNEEEIYNKYPRLQNNHDAYLAIHEAYANGRLSALAEVERELPEYKNQKEGIEYIPQNVGFNECLDKVKFLISSKRGEEGKVDCDHVCTSNCRRVGCNCECGEYHEEQT